MSKTLLITGATGKQGGAVVNALIASASTPPLTILALTRNPESAAAKTLVAKSPTVKLITGDLDHPAAIFSSAGTSIWGVFSVQIFRPGHAGAQREERQSRALVDAALDNGVRHFVYTSVDRHGAKSDSDPTSVPQLATKHRNERYLQEKSAGTNMTWTILRPVAFMENFNPGFVGKASAALWKFAIPPTTPVQLIATADIGFFAAQAFLHSEEYGGRVLSLSGDELTFSQAEMVFQEKMGMSLPRTFGIVAWALLKGVKEIRLMFEWLASVGSAADIVELRRMYPGLMTFGDWLEKESAFVRKS